MRAIECSQHASELGRWESAVAQPHPALRPYVSEYVGGTEETVAPIVRRELPTDIAPVIFNFGPPFQMLDPAGRTPPLEVSSFATGAFDTYVLVRSTGAYSCLQINFTILGARLFLGMPLKALAGRIVALDDVLGAMGRRLEAQLQEARSWAARFDLLDSVLLERIAASRVPDGVRWAWDRLVATRGDVAIGALTRELGWSRKHFAAQFVEHIGLPPKTMARVLRFGRAAELLQGAERRQLADIAYACGYYDQAHFTRDFTAFAGVSPTSLLASRLPNRGGFVVGD